MTLFMVAGARVFIGGVLNFGASGGMFAGEASTIDFAGQVWTEIGQVEALGVLSVESQMEAYPNIDFENPHALTRMRQQKVSIGFPDVELVAAMDYADPGQLCLVEAQRSEDAYAFLYRFNDGPAGGTPSERLFTALVVRVGEALDQANAIMKLSVTLALDSNIVRVLPQPGGRLSDPDA